MALRLVVDPAVIPEYPTLGVAIGVTDFAPVNGPTTPYGHNIPAAAYDKDGKPIPGGPGYFVMRKCNGDPATFFDGPLTPAQVAAIPQCATDVNQASVRQKAQALLAIPSAQRTNAQRDAALNALIRLALGLFDGDT